MSLSNTVVTHLLDPRIHNDSRSEWRLDDAFYASSWKLVDMGVYDTQLTGAEGFYYPAINGVMNSAKNIYLYSDTVLIDSLQNVAQYTSIEALKTSNQGSEDISRFTLLNGMGFRESAGDDLPTVHPGSITLETGSVDYYNKIGGSVAINNQVPIAGSTTAQSGSCMLSDYLQFLRSTPVLAMYPDLRLVIEWDTTGTDYFKDPATTGSMVLSPSVIRPTLIVDEIVGMDPKDADVLEVPYLSTIVERFTVPAVTLADNATVPKQSSFKSQAFTQKFVKDLTFFNLTSQDLADANKWLTTKTRSPAMKGEVLQLIVNNDTLLPDRGINTPALKMHYFNDTQAQLNLPLASYLYNLTDPSGYVLADNTAPLQGQFSVTSVKVGQVIGTLQIDHSRLYGANNAAQSSPFTLICFGTVAKTLTKKGKQIRVSY